MANTFRCRRCGYTAPVGGGVGWTLCPACGSNDVTLTKPKRRPSKKQGAGAAGEGKEAK